MFALNNKELKDLPIVTAQWPKKQMDNLAAQKDGQFQLESSEQDQVLFWAEKLELMFNIGENRRKVYYFVPFLATEAMGEYPSYSWNEDVAKSFDGRSTTVLYASLHFPATHNFFCRVIADLLKNVLKDVKRGTKCFINLGCMEAILPMKCTTSAQQHIELSVYLRYHPLQNIIEFQTK